MSEMVATNRGPGRADVVVVGAGPAGCAAAVTLARAGRDVVMVDRARFPRDKCCGDGLTTEALRRLEALGLQPGDVASWTPVQDVWIRSPSGRASHYPLPCGPGTYAAVARRYDLDAALVDLARRAGATVLDGHGLAGARVEAVPKGPGAGGSRGSGTEVAVDVAGVGTVKARYAIGADGMWSPLRKHLDAQEAPGYLGEWHAFRQYFSGVAPPAATGLWVWFEPELLPGYAWSFPLAGGGANVGFGVRRHPGQRGADLAQLLPALLSRPHIRQVLGDEAASQSSHRAWPIPARVGTTRLSAGGGRALFVGDAARAADPMTGEGIAQALETGSLAALAILGAGACAPDRAATAYRRAVTAGLAIDHRLAGALSSVLGHSRGVRAAVQVTSATGWTRAGFARWMFEDYPRALLATPWRWRRRALSGPGAWASRPADGEAQAAPPAKQRCMDG